jgi:hypothetical protein
VSAVGILLAGASTAETVVQGGVATVRWAAAPGPVSGYQVFVARNGGDMIDAGFVSAPQTTLSGVGGDVVQVAVRAWGYPNGTQAGFEFGPASDPSDPIRFASSALADVFAVVDCISCDRFEILDANGEPVGSFTDPGNGTWDLVSIAALVPGRVQALLRERTSGALWIGDVVGSMLAPYTSAVTAGFAQSRIARPADLDGDGAADIVLHDQTTGRVEIWDVQNGSLVRRNQWSGPIGWRLAGTGDFDGDGQKDLWFDAGHGLVYVAFFRDFNFIGGSVLAAPLADSIVAEVADYDGDGLADMLWRDSDGGLQIGLLRGDLSAPSVALQPIPAASGDATLVPSTSVDLDGDGAAEILLQDVSTGATTIVWPAEGGFRQRFLPTADPLWRLVGID